MSAVDETQVIGDPDGTQVIPAVHEEFAFLPPAEPDPEPALHASWEERYAVLIDEAYTYFAYARHTEPSRMIAAARLAGEIREGLAAGLLPRVR